MNRRWGRFALWSIRGILWTRGLLLGLRAGGFHGNRFRLVHDDRNLARLVDIGDRGRLAEQVDDDRAVLDALDAPGDLLTNGERVLPRRPRRKQMQERRVMMRRLRVRRRIARARLRALLLAAPTTLLLAGSLRVELTRELSVPGLGRHLRSPCRPEPPQPQPHRHSVGFRRHRLGSVTDSACQLSRTGAATARQTPSRL